MIFDDVVVEALPVITFLVIAVILSRMVGLGSARRRQRHRNDDDIGMASVTGDLDEAKAVAIRFFENSNREMRDEIKSMRAMQKQTRSQLRSIKEAVARMKNENRRPQVEPILEKDD